MLITVAGTTKFHTSAILKAAHAMARHQQAIHATNYQSQVAKTWTYDGQQPPQYADMPYTKAFKWALKEAWKEARRALNWVLAYDVETPAEPADGSLIGSMKNWLDNPPVHTSI